MIYAPGRLIWMEFCWHLRWQRNGFWEGVPALFPSCSHFASARGRREQLMASPPKPSLAPSSAHLTPAAAKAKTNIPAGEQLTRFSDRAFGAVLEAKNQGTGWVQLIFCTSLGSTHSTCQGVKVCICFSHHHILSPWYKSRMTAGKYTDLENQRINVGDFQFRKRGGELNWCR